jgi:hypothetical protein
MKMIGRAVKERHDGALVSFMRLLRMNKDFPYSCSSEVEMASRNDVKQHAIRQTSQVYFLLENRTTEGDTIFFDVRIVHPNSREKAHQKKLGAMEEHWKGKRRLSSST